MKSSISRLDEVADVIDSLHKTPQYSDYGLPMVRATDVKYGVLKLDNTLKVDQSVFDEFSRRYKPSINDIVITRVGSYGITSLVKDTNFCLGQNTSVIIPKINPRYLYAAINSPQIKNQIEYSVVGSTQKTLSLKAINSLEIPRFEKYTEDKIAHILSTLDDKIELNRKMNQTLEEMAQVLFKSWFVDFDPVHAKMGCANDEELEVAARELGISKEVLELFPSEFEESELGMIPKGWEVKELISLVKQLKPGTNYQPDRVEDGIPFVNGRHIQDGFLDLTDIKYITEDEYKRVHKIWQPEAYDVLITRIGTLGKVGVILESDLPLALHYNSIDIKADKLSHQFLYFLLKSDFFQKQFHMYKKHAVQEFITIEAVEQLNIVLPNAEKVIKLLGDYFNNIFDSIENNTIQIRTLQKTRDTLLPKLLSGELDVSELEMETL